MHTGFFRITALLTLSLVAVVSSQAQTVEVAAGRTSVKLSSALLNALGQLRVEADANRPGRLRRGVASFFITGGAVDASNARGEIEHRGGLTLTAGDTRVDLLEFVIDTKTVPMLTGLAVVNGTLIDRIPLFDLVLPPGFSVPLEPRFGFLLQLDDIDLLLTADAAAALNGAFGVDAFVEGFDIGVASSHIILEPTRRRH